MAGFIGNKPGAKYATLTRQTFSSPTGTSHTLSQTVTNSDDLLLYINNVKQNPADYTASGTTLTTASLAGGTEMYCLYYGKTTETVAPPASSVGDSHIVDMASSKLTGALPALDGSALTGLSPNTNFIGGLNTANGTDAAHDINIAVGSARDYTDTATMTLASAITKQIDASWAVGTNAGGLDTGSVGASTGYGLYLIRRTDTGVVDVLFSTDMSASGGSVTMPTSYTQKRLIGWVRTDSSSNILSFLQSGDYFRIQGDVVIEFSDPTITPNTFETATLTTPPLCISHGYLAHNNTSETALNQHMWIKTKGAADSATDGREATLKIGTSGTQDNMTMQVDVLADANKQVEYAASEVAGAADFQYRLFACDMITRSNP